MGGTAPQLTRLTDQFTINDIPLFDPLTTRKRSSNTFRTHPPHAPTRGFGLANTVSGDSKRLPALHPQDSRNHPPQPVPRDHSTEKLHTRVIIRQATRRHPGNLFHEHVRRIKLIHNTGPSIPNPNIATHRVNRETPKRRNKKTRRSTPDLRHIRSREFSKRLSTHKQKEKPTTNNSNPTTHNTTPRRPNPLTTNHNLLIPNPPP